MWAPDKNRRPAASEAPVCRLEDLLAVQNEVQTFPLLFLIDAQADERLGDHQTGSAS